MTLAWFCARTTIRGEERARIGLEGIGMIVYLPREPIWRGRGLEKEKAYRPLLARHLFVAFPRDENHFKAIGDMDGVERLLRDGRWNPPTEVPWRALAIVQTVEGELEEEFERRAARAKRKYGDDTCEFIERIKAAAPDRRAEEILALLGRG